MISRHPGHREHSNSWSRVKPIPPYGWHPSMALGPRACRVARSAGVAVACLVAVSVTAASCGGSPGNTPGSVQATSPPTTSSAPSGPSTSSTILQSVAVSDSGGSNFLVEAAPMMWSPYVNVDGFLYSAAPRQNFLADTLTVTNPSGGETENLSDFDDLSSGLANDIDFVMNVSDAAMLGFSSDCGVDPAYPPSLCPISLGQGLTVDSDSANHDDRSVVPLSPGASTQITLSYGPVVGNVKPNMVAAYFDNGRSMPVELTR
jgi:hypothetical protein